MWNIVFTLGWILIHFGRAASLWKDCISIFLCSSWITSIQYPLHLSSEIPHWYDISKGLFQSIKKNIQVSIQYGHMKTFKILYAWYGYVWFSEKPDIRLLGQFILKQLPCLNIILRHQHKYKTHHSGPKTYTSHIDIEATTYLNPSIHKNAAIFSVDKKCEHYFFPSRV